MNDKAKQYYEYLKGKGVDVPPSFESFASTMQDDEKRESYYNYLTTKDVDVAPDFNSFTNTLKKKEVSGQDSVEPVQQPSEQPTTPLNESTGVTPLTNEETAKIDTPTQGIEQILPQEVKDEVKEANENPNYYVEQKISQKQYTPTEDIRKMISDLETINSELEKRPASSSNLGVRSERKELLQNRDDINKAIDLAMMNNKDIESFNDGAVYETDDGERLTNSEARKYITSNKALDRMDDGGDAGLSINGDDDMSLLLKNQKMAQELGYWTKLGRSTASTGKMVLDGLKIKSAELLSLVSDDPEFISNALDVISSGSGGVLVRRDSEANAAVKEAEKRAKEEGISKSDAFLLEYAKGLKKTQNDIRGIQYERSEDLIDRAMDGDVTGFVGEAATLAVESSPFLGAAMMPVIGLPLIGASVQSDKYYEFRESGLSKEEAAKLSAGSALIEVADGIITKGLFNKSLGISGNAIKRLAGKEAMSKAEMTVLRRELGKAVLNNFTVEPSTEFLQGTFGSAIDQYALEGDINWSKAGRDGLIEASAGLATGAAMSSIPAMSYIYAEGKNRGKINTLEKAVFDELSSMSEDPTPESIKTKKETAKLIAKEIIDEGANLREKFLAATPVQKKELKDLSVEESRIQKQLDDNDITPDAADVLNGRLEDVQSKKSKILSEIDKVINDNKETKTETDGIQDEQTELQEVGKEETKKEVTKIGDRLESKYNGLTIDLYEDNKTNTLSLGKIVVDEDIRGEGVGSDVMSEVIDYADKNGLKVILTPSEDFGGDKTRLKSFYKKFGFIENKGKNRDFSHREDMYRNPKNEELSKEKKTSQDQSGAETNQEQQANVSPVPAEEQGATDQIESLRRNEQEELLEAIPEAENAITDGKVDRSKIESEEGKAKFDEIYDKYDKLISPLLEAEESSSTIKEASKKLADRVRSARFIKTQSDMANLQSDPTGLFKVAWDGSMAVVANVIEAGGTIAQAVSDGLNYIKSTDWYKGLSNDAKRKAERMFNENVKRDLQSQIGGDASAARKAFRLRNQDKKPFPQELFRKTKKTLNALIKRWVNRNADLKRLFTKAGMTNVVDRLVTSLGYGGKAKMVFEEAYEKIYKGMGNKKREVLDEIIFNRRIIAIDENRAERGLDPVTHPNNITGIDAQAALDEIQEESNSFDELSGKADAYFDVFREYLGKARDAGLISEELYDSMVEIDYQPRKFIKHMLDADGDLSQNDLAKLANDYGMSKSIIKSLESGSDTRLITDSEFLLQSYINSTEKRLFQNEVSKKLAVEHPKAMARLEELRAKDKLTKKEKKDLKWLEALEKKLIIPKVIGQTSSGSLKFSQESKDGYKPVFYFKDGVARKILLEQSLYDQWMDNKQWVDKAVKDKVATYSGSKVLKAMATGINPLFVVSNIPRDFGHIIMFTDNYRDLVPVSIFKLGRDFIKAVKDIKTESDAYKDFVGYGGMMDFLYIQGGLDEKGSLMNTIKKSMRGKTKEGFAKFFDALTVLNKYSEVGFRVAVYKKSIKRAMKDINKMTFDSQEEKNQVIEDAKYRAARKAREIIDFNQGGDAARELESLLPYLNAAIQGGRVASEYVLENPIEASWKAVQSGSVISAMAVAGSLAVISMFRDDEDDEDKDKTAGEIWVETMELVSPYDKRAYICVPTGKRDKDGNWEYLRISKTQQIRPLLTTSDLLAESVMREMNGGNPHSAKYIYDKSVESFFGDFLPFDPTDGATLISRNPIIGGAIEVATGYDFFREQSIHYEVNKDGVPRMREGYGDDDMPEVYKWGADEFGWSPARTKHFVEKFTTSASTNPYVSLAYGLSNAAIKDDVSFGEESDKSFKKIVSGINKKFYKSTSPYYKSMENDDVFRDKYLTPEEVEKYDADLKLKNFTKNIKSRIKSPDDVNDKMVDEIIEFVNKNYDDAEKKSASNRIKRYIEAPNIAYDKMDIYYERNPSMKAKLFYREYGDVSQEEMIDIFASEFKQKVSPRVMAEYKKFRKEMKDK